MIFAHIARSFRETFPTRASEWALAASLFLWGVILFANPTLFAESQSLAPLSRFSAQATWAWLCLVFGGGRLVMLTVNGAWRRSPHLRAFGAFISCFFWFQISVGLAQADTLVTGLAVYPVMFALDIYNVFRAASDAGSADRIHTGPRHGIDG